MKSKFTSGPWKFAFSQTPETVKVLTVRPDSDSIDGKGWRSKTINVANDKGECLAVVKAYTTEGFVQDFNQWEGNAKLIVAAPELFECLVDCIENVLIDLPDEDPRKAKYKAAIKKATA
jgi:hypothetical protein